MSSFSNWFRRWNSIIDNFSNTNHDEEEIDQEHASTLDTFNSHEPQIAKIV